MRQVVAHDQGSQRACADRIEAEIREFRDGNDLDRVVVVDLLPTMPQPAAHPALDDLDALEAALDGPDPVLPASSLYSYAAFRAGCPVVEFTPGPGPRLAPCSSSPSARACPGPAATARPARRWSRPRSPRCSPPAPCGSRRGRP